VFTSKFVGNGPSSYEKRIYRAAASQRLRNTGLEDRGIVVRLPVIRPVLGHTESPILCIPAPIFLGVRGSGRETKHLSSFSAEVEKKNEAVPPFLLYIYIYIYIYLYGVDKGNFIFIYFLSMNRVLCLQKITSNFHTIIIYDP